MKSVATASVAVLGALGLSAAAAALEGKFTTAGGAEVFTFAADGTLTGTTADGLEIKDSFVVEGNTITFTAPPEHPVCPNAVGVYTFEETETQVTFTLVSDACEARAAGVPAEPWIKATEE
jgi:hypothetical protein